MKATPVRFGIRGFNPKLKRAAEDLEALRTRECTAGLKRDTERRRDDC
jgi:hypothetical protein